MKKEKENNNGSKRIRVEGRRDDDVAEVALTTTKLNGDDGQTSTTVTTAHDDETTDCSAVEVGIPTLRRDSRTGLISSADFFHAFERYRAVYIPRTESPDTAATEELVLSSKDDDNSTSNISHVEEQVQAEQKKETQTRLTANAIHDLFLSLKEKNDIESWCIENDGEPNNNNMKISSSINNGSNSGKSTIGSSDDTLQSYDFLRLNNDPKEEFKRGYCSFIIQNDKAVMNSTLERLPIKDLPIDDDDGSTNDKHIAGDDMIYGPCLWIFFGRNSSNEQLPLQGRPEHTDSITHDATWHYQLSGTKQWVIRPTLKLLKSINKSTCEERGNQDKWPLQPMGNEENPCSNEDLNDEKMGSDTETEKDYDSNGGIPVTVECQEGDVLVINTRLWWHQTFIPYHATTHSVSYARDVYFQNEKAEASLSKNEATSTKTTKPSSDIPAAASSMTNVDGLYAANDIEASTIIFREHTMPDCELHRSSQPNCEVVQLDDGTGAVVSLRPISAGEFFSVADSDESEEEGEEEYNDDEGEDGEEEYDDDEEE